MAQHNFNSYQEYVDEAEAAAYATAAKTGLGDRWKLSPNEQLWVQYQPYLFEKGYELRPRYRPGWIRSWEGTNRNPRVCEDSLTIASFKIMDAVRISDGKRVIIKALDTSVSPKELPILQYLASDNIRSDPRNHCTYALDSFPIPDQAGWVFVVMDSYQAITLVPFETVEDVLDLIRQLLEGLVFMHEHNIAHRDCTRSNIMMQGGSLFATPPHPHPNFSYLTEDGRHDVSFVSRSGRIVKYYFIDFGISSIFPSYEERELVTGEEGRERDIPELLTPDTPYDPFKVDIIIIGLFLQRDFYSKAGRALYFVEPLLKRMTHPEPSDRPTAAEALVQFEIIRETLDSHVLLRKLEPSVFQRVVYTLSDCFWSLASWFNQLVLRRQHQDILLP